MKSITKPQLVSPAGDWVSLHSAVAAGADAVYFGIKGLSMRNLATNFDLLELEKVMRFLHENKKKGYLALNVIVYDHELQRVGKILKKAKEAKVDAVILWDMAVFSMAKQFKHRIHVSTQASISNKESLSWYAKQGAKRVVLARECTLEDVKSIKNYTTKNKIACGLEVFVHGAMCVSVSGRCFLSQHTFAKSANRGECLQPCRREFKIKDMDDESEYILGKDYILSPKDLCTVGFIDKLIKLGIDAFKIEGRNRSPEYVRVVTETYRKAIDAYFEGRLTSSLKKTLKQELTTVYTRGFSDGFYFGQPKKWTSKRLEHTHQKRYVGEIRKFFKRIGVAELIVKDASIKNGDTVICMGKHTPATFFEIDQMQINHKSIACANRGQAVGLKVPRAVKKGDKLFLWQKKDEEIL